VSAVIDRTEAPIATLGKVRALEATLRQFPPESLFTEEQLTSHHFCNGVYCREFFLPAGGVAVGKMHAKESFFLIVKGVARISTADGSVHTIAAPFMAVTQPGSKRVVFALEDTTFLTFHPNPDDEHDLVRLEQTYIIPEALPAPEAQELLE
jgi:hypothetical protein